MKKQLISITLLALVCTIQRVVAVGHSPSTVTQTMLNAFGNPYVSEQDLINFLNVPGIDLHATNKDGQNLLMLATQYGFETLTSTLIQKKIDPNAQDKQKRTSLMLAAQQGSVTNVTTLLNAGAKAKTKDCHGKTAKDYALTASIPVPAQLLMPEKGDSSDQIQAKYIKLQVLKTQQAQGHQAIVALLANHKEVCQSNPRSSLARFCSQLISIF